MTNDAVYNKAQVWAPDDGVLYRLGEERRKFRVLSWGKGRGFDDLVGTLEGVEPLPIDAELEVIVEIPRDLTVPNFYSYRATIEEVTPEWHLDQWLTRIRLVPRSEYKEIDLMEVVRAHL